MKFPNWTPKTARPQLSRVSSVSLTPPSAVKANLIVHREYEAQRAARTVGMSAAAQIADVAFEVVLAAEADRAADAGLIHDPEIAFEEHVRRGLAQFRAPVQDSSRRTGRSRSRHCCD